MGKEDRNPICNIDDFISNKNFLRHMEHIITNGSTDPPAAIPRVMPEDENSGFLSINRAMDLDRLLSPHLLLTWCPNNCFKGFVT
ncbi:hypothetical protein D1007_06010 [Hordeum vulgare]|nr:hypothetical protein D1007_06010 [Hordeum vulgare]